MLLGGHVTIHTFPLRACYFVDIFYDGEFDENDINSVFYGLKHAFGMFTVIPNNNEFAMLWVKNNQSLEDFSHEFIHYLEWVGGIYGRNIKIDLSEENRLFENEDEFKSLFDLRDDDIEYIFNKAEYQTLLNDFLNKLTNLKQKYYSNLTGHQFARKICFLLFSLNNPNHNDILYIEQNHQKNH